MSFLSPVNIFKKFIASQGYELNLHRVAKVPYTGPKIAFIHIAKCGGISVDTALRLALATNGQRRIDRDTIIASSIASFGGSINSLESSYKFSEYHAQHLSKILTYYLQENWHYVSGHITINSKIIERFQNEYSFITILRDPVKRFISNYTFNKLTNTKAIMLPNNLDTDNIVQEAKSILLSRRGWQMANSPTMYLTGRYPINESDAVNMQQEVASNLSKFKVIGFLDNLDKFSDECQELTGQKIDIGHRNTTVQLNTSEQIKVKTQLQEFFHEKETIKLVNKLCKFEMENYRKVRDDL
jgi:hypothetical protein